MTFRLPYTRNWGPNMSSYVTNLRFCVDFTSELLPLGHNSLSLLVKRNTSCRPCLLFAFRVLKTSMQFQLFACLHANMCARVSLYVCVWAIAATLSPFSIYLFFELFNHLLASKQLRQTKLPSANQYYMTNCASSLCGRISLLQNPTVLFFPKTTSSVFRRLSMFYFGENKINVFCIWLKLSCFIHIYSYGIP